MLLEIEIQSYWHAGSGKGNGPGADALVQKTAEGMPFVPGRTVKGLLRDACHMAESLGHVADGTTGELFGRQGSGEASTRRFNTESGRLRPNNAVLGKGTVERQRWVAWASAHGAQTSTLFDIVHSTAIDHDGVVLDKTLRSIEFAVPLTLYAEVEGLEEAAETVRVFLPLVRSLGLRRHRGFGRCAMRLVEEVAR